MGSRGWRVPRLSFDERSGIRSDPRTTTAPQPSTIMKPVRPPGKEGPGFQRQRGSLGRAHQPGIACAARICVSQNPGLVRAGNKSRFPALESPGLSCRGTKGSNPCPSSGESNECRHAITAPGPIGPGGFPARERRDHQPARELRRNCATPSSRTAENLRKF